MVKKREDYQLRKRVKIEHFEEDFDWKGKDDLTGKRLNFIKVKIKA